MVSFTPAQPLLVFSPVPSLHISLVQSKTRDQKEELSLTRTGSTSQVSFSCEQCCEVMKKPKLDAHAQRCWGAQFTCSSLKSPPSLSLSFCLYN